MVVFPPPSFAARITRRGRRALLCLEGELDCATSGLAEAELDLVGDVDELTIDLRDITFMDSNGVHFLLRAHRNHPVLWLVRGGEPVHRVLRVVDVERQFEFVDRPDPELTRVA